MTDKDTLEKNDSIPFYPDHVRTEFLVTLGILGVVVIVAVLGLLFPVGTGDPANPMDTPLHVKPEWYFLALYQLLKFIPKTAGAIAPVIAILLLIIWPFIDRKPDQSPRTQQSRLIAVTFAMLVLIALTIWGEVS
jgi:quinol-cytochrome oxidoreductase complex cytochrome b subunit